ncbi:hypothetical protein WJX84_000157, partial [Apatococcus fuscideae]
MPGTDLTFAEGLVTY